MANDNSLIAFKIDLSKIDRHFGLGVRKEKGRVVVASLKPNSVAGDFFKLNDVIISINGQKVATKADCRDMIVKAGKKILEVVVERSVKMKLTHESYYEPSKESERRRKSSNIEVDPKNWRGLPEDIQKILIARFKTTKSSGVPEAKLLSQAAANSKNRVTFKDGVTQHPIGSDVLPGKILRRPPPL